ncbi:MAG TPA: PAS domain S-box protein [Syntrophales bacterium]|nr:PAS domain S-box protein [Syntrophales bacterium]
MNGRNTHNAGAEADAAHINDQLLRTLTEKSLAGIYLVQDGEFRFLNTNAASYANYEVSELIGQKSGSFVHPEDRERVKADARAMLRGERNSPYVFRILTKQGETRWVMETVTPFFFNGRPALLGNSMNITDRMEAEERLRESEDRYRTIFETTGTATIIVEEDTTVTLVNTEFEKLSGAPKEYWEGKRKWTEFVHEKDRERMLRYHHSRRVGADAAPRNYEFSLINMQGKVRDLIITISMIPGTKRSVASFVDITERKQAEEALKKNERDLKDKTHELEELNAALRVLLKRREEDKLELENNVISNLKKLVMPYIEKIKKGRIEGNDLVSLNVIESNLKDIASPFASKLSSEFLSLTPKELRVADLIKEGKTTKEIAEFMNVSPATVEIHRYHIREKLGLSRKKTNLRTYLSSLK